MSELLCQRILSSTTISLPQDITWSNIPTDTDIEFYLRQAQEGPIRITERALGHTYSWSPEQVAAWKRVTDAVHTLNSTIYLQISPFSQRSQAPLNRTQIKENVEALTRVAKHAREAGFDGVEYSN